MVFNLDWLSNAGSSLADGSIGLGGWGPMIMFWFKVFMWVIAIVIAVMVYWKFWLQYNIKVRVLVKSGNNLVDIKEDRAKLLEDEQGKKKLKLFFTRRGKAALTCPVPSQDYKYKKGKKDYYDLTLDDNYILHPNELLALTQEEAIIVRRRPQQVDAWWRMERELVEKKYATKERWKELIMPAMFIGTLVICFLIMFFMFKELGGGMSSLATSFQQVSQSCLR